MNAQLTAALLFFPLTTLAAQAPTPLPASLELNVAAQVVLDCESVVRLSVGDSKVADVKPLEDMQLLVIGAGEGETTITVWRAGEPRPVEIKVKVGRGAAKPAPDEEKVTLQAGGQRVFTPGGKLLRVAIGDAEIADVKVIGNEKLLLTGGKGGGDTTLIAWTEGGARKSFVIHVVR